MAPPPTTRLAQIVCLAPNEVPAAKSHPATHRTLFAATIWWDAAEFAHALKASAKEWTGNRNVMILFDTKPQSLVIDPPADIEVLGFDQRARMTAKWNDPSDHVWLAGAATEIAKFQKQTCALQVITGN
ncbi:MAG: hypothetical protein EPN75_08815 [Beijerinckiaceae bacterium]|nr:MAG: hypothetical protein EPN75_08815 [Beijerinckiaceae bacterium]